jgi:putative MFS transporter
MHDLSGFRRPWAFWVGVAGITGGVLLHLPMFISAGDEGYQLRGMGFDRWMILGMALIALGFVGVFYGLAPRFGTRFSVDPRALEVRALDASRLRGAHLGLMSALVFAIAIDTQKPFTFTFVLPGVASEYDLQSPSHPAPGHLPVALFPLIAIIGTVVGSLVWGHVGDRIGRRASILLAGCVFIATAMCSVMPSFWQNLVACFFMGAGAGGLLPIAYSLLTEMIPARRRGEVVVLVAGIGTAIGFLFASWTAHWLIPSFGWRVMWLFGVPTGLGVILLNRWIPESPRFLLAAGERSQALDVMRRFGVVVAERDPLEEDPVEEDPVEEDPVPTWAAPQPRPTMLTLFRPPYSALTLALTVYGLAWGLVNFGFLVWLPVHVAQSGVSAGHVTAILAKAALFAIPGSVLVARFYGRWSSKGTLAVAAALEAAVLGVFAAFGTQVVHHNALFTALVVVLLISLWATISVLAPYSAEVYPTRVRAGGAGIAAGASKLGGVAALAIAVSSVAPPSLAAAALLGGIPAAIGALMLMLFGVETRGRRLEEIPVRPLPVAGPEPAA